MRGRSLSMDDVQNQRDIRGITIQQTGVNNVCLPFLIANERGLQPVQANIRFTVSLSKDLRGTHMSRLMEILTDWTMKSLSMGGIDSILNEAVEKLNTDAAKIHVAFKYFIEREAPVSKRKSLLDLDCFFDGEVIHEQRNFILGVIVPLTTLCPCSKEISDVGAHNQRSVCRVQIKFTDLDKTISIEQLAKIVTDQASSPIYSVLKREDEKFVTEAAYKNPKFVEDILRDVVIAIRNISGIKYFSVECENFESIHNHNAYAYHEEEVAE